MTPQEQAFIDSGTDFFNSAFSQIPDANAQEIKAEIVRKLQASTATGTPDSIQLTVGKGLDFIDAGVHLGSNQKVINITDIINQTINGLISKKVGIWGTVVNLFKLGHLTK